VTNVHRSGFVALAGRPNVGKSTLLNSLLQEGILAVSAKPQTTRRRQLAILTLEAAQVVFVDTPGIHRPKHKLGELMNEVAMQALEDADQILAVFDLQLAPDEEDEQVIANLNRYASGKPIIAALNKMDLVAPEQLQSHWDAYERALTANELIGISALSGDNLPRLLEAIIENLPEGPQYYPAGEMTDVYERDIAADLLRAAAMELLRHEVPHSIAVRIDEYKERNEHGAYIQATLFVERESQKGIVIGKGGSMLRKIGTEARMRIEAMSARKVFIELRVKVLPRWRNDRAALKRLGYLRR
jgi:GTP-binding protein Era